MSIQTIDNNIQLLHSVRHLILIKHFGVILFFYFYICMNNTIYGTKFHELPETGDVPLIADISSCILSEPIDVSKFGMLYAGAQKNVAPAGLTIVIIREDLLGHARDITPTMLNYVTHAEAGSMFNTPPCYNIYICKLVLEWLKNDIGGLENMKKINEELMTIIYQSIYQLRTSILLMCMKHLSDLLKSMILTLSF